MTTITTDRLVPTQDVCKTLAIPQGSIKPTHHDWAGRPCITEADAARLLNEHRAGVEANRRRKAENDRRKAQEAETFESDRERWFYTAFAAVLEHGGPYGDRDAPAVAFAVISSDDPENELARVIKQYGEPDVRSIMFVMRKSRRPTWLR